MSAAASLLPELEAVAQHGSAHHRAETLRRIASLFVEGAASFNNEHVALFDDVFGYLIEGVETEALAEMARKLAPLRNAPPGVLRALAYNENIDVAGPVLKEAAIGEADLKLIAGTASQAHLLVLAQRQDLSEMLADILVVRGERGVLRALAAREDGHLSEAAFTALVQTAERKGAPAQDKAAEKKDLDVPQSDRDAAVTAVCKRHAERSIGEADIAEFATSGQYEQALAALAIVCAVPIEVVHRLMKDDRVDPVLILSRAGGLNWSTVRAIIGLRPGEEIVERALDIARENYDRLTAPTAQRVLRFWQVRTGGDE